MFRLKLWAQASCCFLRQRLYSTLSSCINGYEWITLRTQYLQRRKVLVGETMVTFVHEYLFLHNPGEVAASLPEDEQIS